MDADASVHGSIHSGLKKNSASSNVQAEVKMCLFLVTGLWEATWLTQYIQLQ